MNSPTLLQATTVNGEKPVIDFPGDYRQIYTDFRALEHALFSDDLALARDAYARIQNHSPAISEALSRDPFPNNNPRLLSFRELGDCLRKGDLSGAKRASTEFQY